MPTQDLNAPTTDSMLPLQQMPPFGQTASQLGETQVRDLVTNRFEMGRQAAIPYITKAARYYRLFRGIQTQKNYNGLAQLFVPEPFRIVSKKTAKLANAIKMLNVTPQTPQDEDAADTATHLLNFLRRKLNWPILERLAIQESRIVGMSWLKILWDLNKEHPDEPYRGFNLSFDTIDHIILPPDLTIQDIFTGAQIPWLIHYYQMELTDLRKNPNYDPAKISQLEQRAGNSGSRKSIATVLEQARQIFTQAQRAYTIKGSKKFNIYEYWGYLPIETTDSNGQKVTKMVDSLVVLADKDVVIQNSPNPYGNILDERIPFVPFVGRIVGQEMFSIGDIEPSESLFNELNDSRNQRMDTVTLNIDPMKLVMRAANIDKSQLTARRGWIVDTNMENGVTVVPPDMAGVKASTDEEKIIRGDIAQTSGIIDFAPGSEVQSGVEIDTARGAIIAKNDADIIAEEELELLKISLKKLYRIVLTYSQIFLDRQFPMRIMQKGTQSFQNIDRTAIRGSFDLDVDMETLQDKTTRQQLSLLMLAQARETPGANVGKFFTDTLEILKDGEIEINEYYQPPQPPPPESPKISIAVKAELTPFETDEVFKLIPGVDKSMADPMLRPEGRSLAKGVHSDELDTLQKQSEIMSNMQPNGQSSSNSS